MDKQKESSYRKRKPDLETESLRIWTSIGIEAKEVKKLAEEGKHKIEVDCGKGFKMRLIGFTKMIDEKTDQIVFAYKFKKRDRIIMYYLPDNLTQENKQKIKIFMTKVQAIAGMIGYELIDAQKSSITAADEAKRLKKKFTSDYMK
jgi:hypothetical protein